MTRLLNVAKEGATPDLRKVEFAQSAQGDVYRTAICFSTADACIEPRMTVLANKEVILSAGAINTPHILLLSGVGNKKSLEDVGITTIVESPGVGQNFIDHPLLANQWLVNANNTLDDIGRDNTLAEQLEEQWQSTRTGQLVDVGGNLFSWLRVAPSVLGGCTDPAAGPTSSHIELFPVVYMHFLTPKNVNTDSHIRRTCSRPLLHPLRTPALSSVSLLDFLRQHLVSAHSHIHCLYF